ncbi:MAG: hemin uptake protein HemP [Sneathiella sp.]
MTVLDGMMKQPLMDKQIDRLSRDLETGRVSSKDLFAKSSELIILHDEQEYRMRITGNGKLILTK